MFRTKHSNIKQETTNQTFKHKTIKQETLNKKQPNTQTFKLSLHLTFSFINKKLQTRNNQTFKQPNKKQSNNQYKMAPTKETLETRFKELLTEKTEALKKMQYLKVVELRDKVNEVLLQLEKTTSVDYIKIVHGYEKTEKGYYPHFES